MKEYLPAPSQMLAQMQYRNADSMQPNRVYILSRSLFINMSTDPISSASSLASGW